MDNHDSKREIQFNAADKHMNRTETKQCPMQENQDAFAQSQKVLRDRSNREMALGSLEYNNMDSLCDELATHWSAGKALVFDGTLRSVLQMERADGQYMDWIDKIDRCAKSTVTNQDYEYTKLLYSSSPSLRNRVISELSPPLSMQEFGQLAMSIMVGGNGTKKNMLFNVLSRLLSLKQFSQIAGASDPEIAEEISSIERRVNELDHNSPAANLLYYHLVYVLSDDKMLHLDGCPEFASVKQLKEYMKSLSDGSAVELFRFCAKLLVSEKKMHPMLYGWLAAQGCITHESEWLM